MRILPCWVVDVRHERFSGRLGHFVSRPMSWTEARKLLVKYEATGTKASIRCLEDLVEISKMLVRREIEYEEALILAKGKGYSIEKEES